VTSNLAHKFVTSPSFKSNFNVKYTSSPAGNDVAKSVNAILVPKAATSSLSNVSSNVSSL
jgi:hypothetical protein